MTCIVGLIANNEFGQSEVWMGADSAQESNGVALTRKQPKLVRREIADDRRKSVPMIIGGCGTDRLLQIVRYELELPVWNREPLHYMVCDFNAEMRKCINKSPELNDTENWPGSALLIAFCGRLFTWLTDFSVEESERPYRAIGSGEDAAMGSLHSTGRVDGMFARHRLQFALEAAADVRSTVRPDFVFEKL